MAKNFLEIDKTRLDDHLENQPLLFKKYSDKMARAKRDMDLAYDQLKMIEVEATTIVRTKPKRFGIKKVTETAIKQAVQMHPKVRKQEGHIIELKYDYGLLVGTVEALQHRKRSLECLTTLHGQQYFSKVNVVDERLAADNKRKKK